VPTLVLDGGEALIESTIILDYLDELVGSEKAMIAPHGPERRRHLRICALATGLGDKSVSLVYESVLRKEQLKLWVERCEAQISGALEVLHACHAQIARRANLPQRRSVVERPKSTPHLRRPASARGALRDRHECWKRDAMDAAHRLTSDVARGR
jgi:glutathione S-transferase